MEIACRENYRFWMGVDDTDKALYVMQDLANKIMVQARA